MLNTKVQGERLLGCIVSSKLQVQIGGSGGPVHLFCFGDGPLMPEH